MILAKSFYCQTSLFSKRHAAISENHTEASFGTSPVVISITKCNNQSGELGELGELLGAAATADSCAAESLKSPKQENQKKNIKMQNT